VFVRLRAQSPKTPPVTELPAGTRVSGIVPDVRHPGTVRIEVGGKAVLTVPSAALERLGVGVGSVLEEKAWQELCKSADAEAAFRSALVCLGRRPYSRRDLARRLVMRGHPPEAADHAVVRAEASGLVNDETYARHYAQTRTARGRGPMRLRRELAVMGVASAIIDRVLSEEAETADPGVVRTLARKRAAQLGDIERKDRFRRVVAFLARRGYAGPDVRRVVREALQA
jgi:regulatory protein